MPVGGALTRSALGEGYLALYLWTRLLIFGKWICWVVAADAVVITNVAV